MFFPDVRILVLITIAGVAAAAELPAQTLAGTFPAPPALAEASGIDSLNARADSLMQIRKFNAARYLYRKAAVLRLTASELPVTELRALANAHYYDGQNAKAAAVLDELAGHAAHHGDIVAQADAYLDAAWLMAGLDDYQGARRRLARVRTLLASPYLPEAERRRLGERIR